MTRKPSQKEKEKSSLFDQMLALLISSFQRASPETFARRLRLIEGLREHFHDELYKRFRAEILNELSVRAMHRGGYRAPVVAAIFGSVSVALGFQADEPLFLWLGVFACVVCFIFATVLSLDARRKNRLDHEGRLPIIEHLRSEGMIERLEADELMTGGSLREIEPRSSSESIASRVKGWVQGALAVWALSVFPLMLSAAFPTPWPGWLELPWTSMSDFVVASDGRIFAYNPFYAQMMVYDASGNFQQSWSGPDGASGTVCLAATEDGRLFLNSYNTIFAFSSNGEELLRIPGDAGDSRVWRFTAAGEVKQVPDPAPGVTAPNRLIGRGEILFSEGCGTALRYKEYDRPDGGTVQRKIGPRLTIHFPDGHTKTIGTPWYLLWAQLPFPVIPWILFAVWAKLEDKSKKR